VRIFRAMSALFRESLALVQPARLPVVCQLLPRVQLDFTILHRTRDNLNRLFR